MRSRWSLASFSYCCRNRAVSVRCRVGQRWGKREGFEEGTIKEEDLMVKAYEAGADEEFEICAGEREVIALRLRGS